MSFREVEATGGTLADATAAAVRDGWCASWGADGSPEEAAAKELHQETAAILNARRQTIPAELISAWIAAVAERSLEGVYRRRLFALPGGVWLGIAARRLGILAHGGDCRRDAAVRKAEMKISDYLKTGVLPKEMT